MQAAVRLNVKQNKKYVWIGTDAWSNRESVVLVGSVTSSRAFLVFTFRFRTVSPSLNVSKGANDTLRSLTFSQWTSTCIPYYIHYVFSLATRLHMFEADFRFCRWKSVKRIYRISLVLANNCEIGSIIIFKHLRFCISTSIDQRHS